MSLTDALAAVCVDKGEKKKGEKRYVSFKIEEWDQMEKVHGKKIDPADVKNLILGIFSGVVEVKAARPKAS